MADNNKYPQHFIGIAILYAVVLLLSLTIINPAFYALQNIILILMMFAPAIAFALYFIEKPKIKQKLLRYIFIFLTTLSLIVMLILISLFF